MLMDEMHQHISEEISDTSEKWDISVRDYYCNRAR